MEERSEIYQVAEKILYSISNKSGLRCELENIKNIRAKDSKKRHDDSSDYSRDNYYSNSSQSINSGWDEDIQPSGCREINRLDHVVNNIIRTNKY